MEDSGKHILIISPEAWGKNLLSKHHYARFLAEKNVVYFLNPATGYSLIPFVSMQLTSMEVQKNLHVISYKNYLPRLNSWPAFIRNWVYHLQAKRVLKFIGNRPELVWSFDPRRYSNQHVWNAKNSIYHSVDLHPDSQEREMIQSSNLVVGISELVCEGLIKHGAHPIQVSHGCHADTTNTEKANLPGTNSHKAIYTGNFHKHVDYSLLIQLATENPNCDFILVGPTEPSNISATALSSADLEKLQAKKNIFAIGSVAGEELHRYLNAADICLVLFKKEFEVIHHAPHKIMGYLASGRVVLANPMAGYADIPEPLMIQIPQEKITSMFQHVMKNLNDWNSSENTKLRKEFASANHYRVKIHQILGKLPA